MPVLEPYPVGVSTRSCSSLLAFVLAALFISLAGCGGTHANNPIGVKPTTTLVAVPTLTFAAQPTAVAAGQNATLTWDSSNATSVTIDHGVGTVPLSGSLQIAVSEMTTFTATATGAGGSVQERVTVTVAAPPAITLTVCPTAQTTCTQGATSIRIQTTHSATLSWDTSNATNLIVQEVPGKIFNLKDSYTTPALSQSASYTLIATGPGGTASARATINVISAVPAHQHVIIVLEENHSFEQVIGNSVMPFLNQLANQGALATNYFANSHGSLRDYFMLTAGNVLVASGDYTGTVTADNVAAQIVGVGKTWKSYAQNLPSVGYTGGDVYPYVKRHNPLAYFTDIINSPTQVLNLVPFTQFSPDLQNATLPNFSFIAPDVQHDAHDCPVGMNTCVDQDKLAAADQWLQQNLKPLLDDKHFQADGLLLIVFDEGSSTDTQNVGGHVAVVAIGPNVRQGYKSTVFYQHENTLRTICEALELAHCPGSGTTAKSMLDLFAP